MERLRSGLHRKSRKDSPQRPTIVTDSPSAPSSGKTTPEPGSAQPLQVPGVTNKKTSPFRALRDLSRSHKRARSPAPGSETNSPQSALSVDRLMTSPHPLSALSRESHTSLPTTINSSHEATAPSTASTRQAPEMPSFLSSLSPSLIDGKFQEILWMERERVSQSMTNPSPDFRWARVSGDHLKKLDRYMNIQPWQNNRVRLCVPSGKQDYINASPITLPSLLPTIEPDRYIAMQGPKHKTTDHVWRMVVEQLESPAVVVMLTETHEANIEKCWPYFPRRPEETPLVVNKKDEFGDGFRASVRCEAIEETEAGDAIELRKLVIRVYKRSNREVVNGSSTRAENTPEAELPVDESGDVKMSSPSKTLHDEEHSADENDARSVNVEIGRPPSDEHSPVTQQPSPPAKEDTPPEDYEERIVWHFLYKKWPDFGVPALEDLDSFFTLMRLSREKNASPSNPRIVHCSAGVGRSGTFIALDHLMREMDAGLLENWDTPSHIRHQHQVKKQDDDNASTEGQNGHLQDDAKVPEAQKMEVEGEHLFDEGSGFEEETYELDDLIFHVVNQLREQRKNMVQADAQFQFIYHVMQKLWLDKYDAHKPAPESSTCGGLTAHHPRPHSATSPRLMTPDGEPVAKRLEVDPFVETE